MKSEPKVSTVGCELGRVQVRLSRDATGQLDHYKKKQHLQLDNGQDDRFF